MDKRKVYLTRLDKLKFFAERRVVTILLWIFTLLAIFLIIKTSNDPIIGFLKGSFIEDLFQQFSSANSFISEISVGYLVSVIFYVIVVYLPEKQRKKDVELFINSKCESLIFSSYALIAEIIKKSNLQYDYKDITENEFLEVCKAVNPKEHQYNFANNITSQFQNHLGYKIYNDWTRIIKEIDEILRLLPFINTGLLKKIYAIYNNFLNYLVKDLAVVEKLNNDSLESWSSTLYSLYLSTKDLRNYYRLYSKTEFTNDPWK